MKPITEEERELHYVLSRLKNLEVLFLEKNSYRVKNSKLLNKFINKTSTQAILKHLKQKESIKRTALLSKTSEGTVKKVKRLIRDGQIKI